MRRSTPENADFLSLLRPWGERIRGEGERFTLTPAPFDGLTALSLSKGSPLKGEGDHGKGHYREEI